MTLPELQCTLPGSGLVIVCLITGMDGNTILFHVFFVSEFVLEKGMFINVDNYEELEIITDLIKDFG